MPLNLNPKIAAWVIYAAVFVTGSMVQAGEEKPRAVAVDVAVVPLLEEGHFPGAAVAVLRDGVPAHVGSYGLANVAHQAPVTSKTVFELASLTKQMTALAVLDLAQEGRLSLTDPVIDYVEDAPAEWSQITVGQLLSHMGGLAHRFEDRPRDEFLLNYSAADMLSSAKNTTMTASPGTDWNYSDQGYFLLGLVIEAIAGTTFSEHMQDRFFDPFEMTQTHLLDQSAIVPGLAQGYIYQEGELRRGRRVWQFGLASHFGVLSSIDDMIRWEEALHNRQGGLANAIADSWEIQRSFDNGGSCTDWGYARGWWTIRLGGRQIVYHGGYSGTAYIRDVSRGLSAIVLTNREASEGQIEPMLIAWAALHAIDPEIPAKGYRCWK